MPRRLACAVLWTLALATFSVATGASPSVVSAQFVPLIVPIDRADPVLYEARVSGSPTRVVLVLNAASGTTSERALRDDGGTGGDRIRGDGIYTVTLSVPEITSLLRPDDVLRAEVGFLDVYQGTTRQPGERLR
jgi:hypothetical protein